MEDEHQHHRCEVKRFRIGEAAGADPDMTRQYADLLLRAAVHDQCRSGIRQLIQPLVAALGHRAVQQAIITYARSGTDAEKVGATMAWYFAQPALRYASRDDLRLGVPTQESEAERDELADLRAEYRAACLAAFLDCDDPEARRDLSLAINLDASVYPEHLQARHEQAKRIVMADPERYRVLLRRSGAAPTEG
jgi:hypothetical protein